MEKKREEMNMVEFVEKMKGQLEEYFDLRVELFKVTFTEKVSKAFSKLITVLLLMVFGFFDTLFLSLVAGYYFGGILGSIMQGFLVVALFYVVIFLAIILFRKLLIQTPVVNFIISIIYDDDDEA